MNYHFYQAGSIPGVAGIFAGVVVEVDDVTREIRSVVPLGAASGQDTTISPGPAVETSQPQTPPSIPLTNGG